VKTISQFILYYLLHYTNISTPAYTPRWLEIKAHFLIYPCS